MPEYAVSEIRPADRNGRREMEALLLEAGIRRDENLDYSCGIYDDEGALCGTGSLFRDSLRCLAVRDSLRGEGLMEQLVTHLMQVEFSRGNTHLFVYTKCGSAFFFKGLGFHEIARIPDEIVFLENRRDGFRSYIDRLKRETERRESGAEKTGEKPAGAAPDRERSEGAAAGGERSAGAAPGTPAAAGTAAIVMNANPFTRGHRYLVEKAAAENALVHLFILSADEDLFPFAVRKRLVREGIAGLHNVILHESGPYIISSATFPSYFQRDDDDVIRSHASLDAAVFSRIAGALGIGKRYVGSEPFSHVTGIYNEILGEMLPASGVELKVIPRLENGGRAVSASDVRALLKENGGKGIPEALRELLPDSTAAFLESPEAAPVLERIREAGEVRHY